MAALFADENVPRIIVDTLRALGHDVLTAKDAGRSNQGISDVDQLRFAVAHSRAVMTNNDWDFSRLHRADPNHAGIVTFTQDSDSVSLGQRIHVAIQHAGLLGGQLIKVTRPHLP